MCMPVCGHMQVHVCIIRYIFKFVCFHVHECKHTFLFSNMYVYLVINSLFTH